METRMSDEKQPPAPLEATALPEGVEACAKVLYDISDHARDFEALARLVLADRKTYGLQIAECAVAKWILEHEADRAARIAAVEEAFDAAHEAISAIVAAAKGEKP